MDIQKNLATIQEQITVACLRSGRNPLDVKVIAVTKYVSEQTTKDALDAGVIHIGENRVEGGVEKYDALGERGIWHFIGSLQTKKVKKMLGKFSYLHSLDRVTLAREIQRRMPNGENLGCFVQVNVSGEETKAGVSPEELIPFIQSLQSYSAIKIVGLMTMAPFYEDPDETRPVFRKLKELGQDVQALQLPHAPCFELSMGMSNDYIVAVEEGATFVRIGSSLVGSENKKTF